MEIEKMTLEEKIELAKECGLIDDDGASNVIIVEDIATDAYLTAEYNQILINLMMEG
nr:MAG TPA: hypothetical protein [Caudoviricetes sp.]